ncbi:DUF998 domain-containing protein [Microbacterium sp. E-13]|uniref:DUF998 domain-containing protein n=1 Tax=Microbacterium sp. E-13 TaxID=3404048 RepID=UPI003CE6ABC7
MSTTTTGFDKQAAITRSLLGWGVVAGPFYIVVGLILALTRPGFDVSRHALSLLTLGEYGWMQRANLILSGLMVIAAAFGILRAIRNGRGLATGVLVAIYGAGMVLGGVFVPDPVAGFPPGSSPEASVSGILHLVFAGLGILSLGSATFAFAGWARSQSFTTASRLSIAAGLVVIVGFIAGGALSQLPLGIALIWCAVIAGSTWLAFASALIYRWTPSPVPTSTSSH